MSHEPVNIKLTIADADPDRIVREASERMHQHAVPHRIAGTGESCPVVGCAKCPPDRVLTAPRPPTPRVEEAIKRLAEALFDDGFPAEIQIVDRRAKYTVSHKLRVGVHDVTVVVGPYPPPAAPSHMRVVTRRPSGATGPTEIVAVCETEGAAWALVDEIAAERTPSGRLPLWFAQAVSYPVRR